MRPLVALGVASTICATGTRAQARPQACPVARPLPTTHVIAPQSVIWRGPEIIAFGSAALEHLTTRTGPPVEGDTSFAAIVARPGGPMRTIRRPAAAAFFDEPRALAMADGRIEVLWVAPDSALQNGAASAGRSIRRAVVDGDRVGSPEVIAPVPADAGFSRWQASDLVRSGDARAFAYRFRPPGAAADQVGLLEGTSRGWRDTVLDLQMRMITAVELAWDGDDLVMVLAAIAPADLRPGSAVRQRPHYVRRTGGRWSKSLPLTPSPTSNATFPVTAPHPDGVIVAWIDGLQHRSLAWRLVRRDGSLGALNVLDGFTQLERSRGGFPGLVLAVDEQSRAHVLRLRADGWDDLGAVELRVRVIVALAGPPGRPHVVALEPDPAFTSITGRLVTYDFGCAWRRLDRGRSTVPPR